MEIIYSKRFKKEYKKRPENIRKAFKKRLKIFCDDKFHPILNNHKLNGEYDNYRSFNITADWRVIFEEKENQIILLAIGSHSELYS